MHWRLTTDTSNPVVSTAAAKIHLRVTHSDDDTYIDTLVETARRMVEKATGRSMFTQTYKLYLDDFPASGTKIYLPMAAPLQSVTSVKYYDTDATEQTLSSDYYNVDTHHEPGLIQLAEGYSWPEVETQYPSAVTIEYDTGYDDSDATVLPAEMVHAVKLVVGHMYNNRDLVGEIDAIKNWDMALAALINNLTVGWRWA